MTIPHKKLFKLSSYVGGGFLILFLLSWITRSFKADLSFAEIFSQMIQSGFLIGAIGISLGVAIIFYVAGFITTKIVHRKRK